MKNYNDNTDDDLLVKNYRKVTRIDVPKTNKVIHIESECYFRSIEDKILTIGINTHLLAQKYNVIYLNREPINDIKVIIPLDWRKQLRIDKFKPNEQFKIRMYYNKEKKYFKLINRSR